MSSTLDDFFGDGSEESIPECSFCGDKEGELIVSIQDAYGPTHWHHEACEAAADAKKGTPLTPTWDEAMEIMINDPLIDGRETADIVRTRVNKIEVEGRIWQDPCGPTHTYFLSLPHVQNGIPQYCSRADYDCTRVLAGQLKLDCLAVPVLSDVQFGIQVLGFEMPWAWNKYLENRAKNDRKYKKYVRKMAKSFFSNFLVRSGLS